MSSDAMAPNLRNPFALLPFNEHERLTIRTR
jgi:hypothetical protein